MYLQEIEKLIRRALLMFAEGCALQKSSLFGFVPRADDDNKKVLKIHKASSEILENLYKDVDVHKIGEERNIGSFTYASTVRGGGKFLESSSQHVVVKSSTDLFENVSPGAFGKFGNQSANIKEIKAKWNKKMRQLQEKD